MIAENAEEGSQHRSVVIVLIEVPDAGCGSDDELVDGVQEENNPAHGYCPE